MGQGTSGSYAVNGVSFTQSPTSGKWSTRTNYGTDGAGHPIYPAKRDFELEWNVIPISDLYQIINAYNVVGNTGTAVVDLPHWGASSYTFKSYSGTTMQEPEVGEYFVEYATDVRLLITNIRTN